MGDGCFGGFNAMNIWAYTDKLTICKGLCKLDDQRSIAATNIEKFDALVQPIFEVFIFWKDHEEKGQINIFCGFIDGRGYFGLIIAFHRFSCPQILSGFRHSCAINMLASGKAVSDVKNHLGHENSESTMIYLHMDLKTKRQVQKKFIEYCRSTLKHDPKIDDLIDWQNKKQTLAWLDSL